MRGELHDARIRWAGECTPCWSYWVSWASRFRPAARRPCFIAFKYRVWSFSSPAASSCDWWFGDASWCAYFYAGMFTGHSSTPWSCNRFPASHLILHRPRVSLRWSAHSISICWIAIKVKNLSIFKKFNNSGEFPSQYASFLLYNLHLFSGVYMTISVMSSGKPISPSSP